VNEVLSQTKIQLAESESYLRLSPARDGTDGFFAAVLVKS